MLTPRARLDDLINALVELTDTYFDRQLYKDLNLPDVRNSTALQRFLDHHNDSEENVDSYDIVKIDDMTFKLTQKETLKTYWVELVHNCNVPCDPDSCRVNECLKL